MKIHKFTFLGLFVVLTFIFNVLVLGEVQGMYLREIFSFLYISIIPGLVSIYALKVKGFEVWEVIIMAVGLSISFLMFSAFIINQAFVLINIPNPLTLPYIMAAIDIYALAAFLIGYARQNEPYIDVNSKIPTMLNIILFAVPLILLISGILGTFLLNNGGNNYIQLCVLGIIPIYILFLVYRSKSISDFIFCTTIYCISLLLLLMLSLRSQHITGWDINGEFIVFQQTKLAKLWSIFSDRNPYKACLSITILPTVYSLITKVGDEMIYKFLFQMFFALMPVTVFVTLRKYVTNSIAFLSVIYLIMQPFFTQPMTALIRQEIAFFIYALMLFVLFHKTLSAQLSKLLFLTFGFTLVVAHYSTTYVALILFYTVWIVSFLYKYLIAREASRKLLEKMRIVNNFTSPLASRLTFKLITVLFLFTFLWNSQLTQTTGEVTSVITETLKNMTNIFTQEAKSQEVSRTIAVFNTGNVNTIDNLKNYQLNVSAKYKSYKDPLYLPSEYKGYSSYPLPIVGTTPVINKSLASAITSILQIIKLITKLFIIVGITYIIVVKFRNNLMDKEYIILGIISTVIIVIMIVHPTLGIRYNISRIYLQILVNLCIASVFGGYLVFFYLKENHKLLIIGLLYSVMFLYFSGFTAQFLGGDALMQLNNYGDDFEKVYVYDEEIKSAEWLNEHRVPSVPIFADIVSNLRIQNVLHLNANNAVLPQFIFVNSYVYARNANLNGRSDAVVEGKPLIYNYPLEFLNSSKNLIYSNGKSSIFK